MPRAYDTGSFDAVPIGGIVPIGYGSNLENYLPCDGAALSTTAYPELYAAIGNTFDSDSVNLVTPPGAGQFRVPNLGNRVPVGRVPSAIGSVGGESATVLGITQIPNHKHAEGYGGIGTYGSANLDAAVGNQTGGGGWGVNTRPLTSNMLTTSGTYPSTTNQAHNNMQPYLVCQWAIRAF